LTVIVEAAPTADPARVVAHAARRAGLTRWRIEPTATLAPGRAEFELLPPRRRRRLAPGPAWDATYRLRGQPEVAHAEPLFRYDVTDLHRPPATRSGGGGDDPGTDHRFEWSLEKARVLGAWAQFGARLPGAGVTIPPTARGQKPGSRGRRRHRRRS
jgi:hypothetical protein